MHGTKRHLSAFAAQVGLLKLQFSEIILYSARPSQRGQVPLFSSARKIKLPGLKECAAAVGVFKRQARSLFSGGPV